MSLHEVSEVLKPYKELVGMVASVITIGQFFSGVPICYDIYKTESTKDKNSTPFVGGVVMGMLILKYALILQDQAMFQVNVAAIILNIMYCICFAYYACEKWDEIYLPMTYGSALTLAVFSYVQMEDPEHLEFRYGFLITVLSLMLLASPLVEVKAILREKDASSIPFPIVFMALWVSLSWLLYGIILENIFMIIQNIIGLILCLVQLSLYFMYPKARRASAQ